MQRIRIKSNQNHEIIDITGVMNDLIRKSMFKEGICTIFVNDATSALTTIDAANITNPSAISILSSFINFSPDNPNMGSSIMASVIGQSITIPVTSSTLVLGTNQRLVLVELAGPKECHITISTIKSDGDSFH